MNTDDSRTMATGHMAWCALVALGMARQNGAVQSVAQENLFLIRWLATALKQRRFRRDVTPDIEWFLREGRTRGTAAKLRSKLDYVWRSATGDLSEQSDLFRLTYAMELAKDTGWTYRLLNDKEWAENQPSGNIDAISISRASLDASFNENGQQTSPLHVRLSGNIGGLENVLNRCGFYACQAGDQPDFYSINVKL